MTDGEKMKDEGKSPQISSPREGSSHLKKIKNDIICQQTEQRLNFDKVQYSTVLYVSIIYVDVKRIVSFFIHQTLLV